MLSDCTPTKGTIGRGNGNAAIVLTNLPSNKTLHDGTDIQTFLIKLASAGIIKPSINAYFPIHFGPGYTIKDGSSTSCLQFCAYHGTIAPSASTGGQYLMYGVLPDLTTPGCNTGCGSDPLVVNRVTLIASHELVESITDPLVGSNTLSWYSQAGKGEIGDLCNHISATTKDSNNNTWVVQKQWSNFHDICYSPL